MLRRLRPRNHPYTVRITFHVSRFRPGRWKWKQGDTMTELMKGRLVLADGTAVEGIGAGAPGVAVGELVFQTGMTGYQEALTDPSYAGQLLIFTYPLLGNYGTGPAADQSTRAHALGAIMHELLPSAGHRETDGDLQTWLQMEGIPALAGVDTRFLTRQVRLHGVVPAALA